MKRLKKINVSQIHIILVLLVIIFIFSMFSGCTDTKTVIEEDRELPNDKGAISGFVNYVGDNCTLNSKDDIVTPPCTGPFPKHEIRLYNTDGYTVAKKAITKSDGSYHFEMTPGDYIIYTAEEQKGKVVDKKNFIGVRPGKTEKFDFEVNQKYLKAEREIGN